MGCRFIYAAPGLPRLRLALAHKASQPASTTNHNAGDTIVIPATGIAAGDLLLAVIKMAPGVGGIATKGTGFSNLVQDSFNAFYVDWKLAGANEPANYTWTCAQISHSRTGCLAVIRGAKSAAPDVFDLANTFNVPSLSVSLAGSLMVAVSAGVSTDIFNENYTANAPLSLETQHVTRGARAYQLPQASALAIEENLQPGTVSGRSFSNTTVISPWTAGIIVEPA